MAKHKGPRIPGFAKKIPGKGQHGVSDKGAHKVGQQWEKENKKKEGKKDD